MPKAKKQKSAHRRGFTLIELLVVIVIVGILATLAIIALNGTRAKARDARRISDIKQMQTALELFFSETDRYPTAGEFVLGGILTNPGATATFMGKIPHNPQPYNEGACAEAGYTYFDYVYTPIGSGPTGYTIDYCLSGNLSDISAGINQASASGLSVVPVPAAPVASCPLGQYLAGGLAPCTDVGSGYYSSVGGTRLACPANTHTLGATAGSIADCIVDAGIFAGPDSSSRTSWSSGTLISTADTGGDNLISAAWSDPSYAVGDSYYYQIGLTGLQAWLRMDGDVSDASGNGRNGFFPSVPTTPSLAADKFGHAGYAYAFSVGGSPSAGDLVAIADNSAFTFADGSGDKPFTLSAWINPTGWYLNNFVIMSKAQTVGASEWALYVGSNGRVKMRLFQTSSANVRDVNTGNGAVTANAWQHVIATYDGRGGNNAQQGIRIYVNGAEQSVTELARAGAYSKMTDTASRIEIGRLWGNSSGNEFYAIGGIDDARIYNRELSSAEIGTLYNEGSALANRYLDGLPVSTGQSTLYVNAKSSGGSWGTEKSFIINHQ